MSFLNELKKRRDNLKETETVVTNVDGQRFVERDNKREPIDGRTYGFVVDTKPDDIPILVTDFIFIGSQDCTASSILNSNNIKHVLSIGINVDMPVNHKFVECLDLPETNILPVLQECLPFIRKVVLLKDNILIHCNAGVSRTSMITIAYLMQYENMTFDDAYNLVKEKRPAIQPNAGFKRQLKKFTPGQLINS